MENAKEGGEERRKTPGLKKTNFSISVHLPLPECPGMVKQSKYR
jgi:hypothetical protein